MEARRGVDRCRAPIGLVLLKLVTLGVVAVRSVFVWRQRAGQGHSQQAAEIVVDLIVRLPAGLTGDIPGVERVVQVVVRACSFSDLANPAARVDAEERPPLAALVGGGVIRPLSALRRPPVS